MRILDTLSDWSWYWLKEAELIANRSKDPSTKCGAAIVDGKFLISKGYNGFPQRVSDSVELYNHRPTKYARVLHSELNAILTAKRDLTDMSIFTTHAPCSQCMAAIIQVGITKVVTYLPKDGFSERWVESNKEAICMAEEAGVEYYQVRRQ